MTTKGNVPDDNEFRITRLRAKNYRSIRNLDMELGPLTVLVGPNASGKSNVLDVLRFIRDAVYRGVNYAVSQRDGMDSIRHQRPGPRRGRPRDVELGVSATFRGVALDYNFVLAGNADGGYRVKREYGEYGSYKLDADSTQVKFRINEGRVETPSIPSDLELEDLGTEDLSFFAVSRYFPTTGFSSKGANKAKNPRSDSQVRSRLLRTRYGLLDIGFYHGFPNVMRSPQKQLNARLLDEDGQNIASVLWEIGRGKRNPRGIRDIREALSHALPGITNVTSKPVRSRYLVVQFEHSNIDGDKGIWLDAAQESDGTLRILGLLTAVHQPRQPPLLGIEEPELAIHPGALPILADEFQEASLRMQVMITTHSPDFIDRFPVECIRAVEFVDGETRVGKVSERQASAVRDRLFTQGELHRMEGLRTVEE